MLSVIVLPTFRVYWQSVVKHTARERVGKTKSLRIKDVERWQTGAGGGHKQPVG